MVLLELCVKSCFTFYILLVFSHDESCFTFYILLVFSHNQSCGRRARPASTHITLGVAHNAFSTNLFLKIALLHSLDSEAYVIVRKGKIILGYEINLKLNWQGEAKDS